MPVWIKDIIYNQTMSKYFPSYPSQWDRKAKHKEESMSQKWKINVLARSSKEDSSVPAAFSCLFPSVKCSGSLVTFHMQILSWQPVCLCLLQSALSPQPACSLLLLAEQLATELEKKLDPENYKKYWPRKQQGPLIILGLIHSSFLSYISPAIFLFYCNELSEIFPTGDFLA